MTEMEFAEDGVFCMPLEEYLKYYDRTDVSVACPIKTHQHSFIYYDMSDAYYRHVYFKIVLEKEINCDTE